MPSKREQIVRLRTENPILRLTQIADTVGVRKSYAHKVLTQAELPTKSVLIAKKNIPTYIYCSVECSRKGQKNDSSYDLRLSKQIDAP